MIKAPGESTRPLANVFDRGCMRGIIRASRYDHRIKLFRPQLYMKLIAGPWYEFSEIEGPFGGGWGLADTFDTGRVGRDVDCFVVVGVYAFVGSVLPDMAADISLAEGPLHIGRIRDIRERGEDLLRVPHVKETVGCRRGCTHRCRVGMQILPYRTRTPMLSQAFVVAQPTISI